jgi:hypothetical protein
MPDGSVWEMFLSSLSARRSREIAGVGTGYNEEYEFGMENPEVLVDWAVNNLNWVDVSRYSVSVKQPSEADYQEGWVNGRKEILDAP